MRSRDVGLAKFLTCASTGQLGGKMQHDTRAIYQPRQNVRVGKITFDQFEVRMRWNRGHCAGQGQQAQRISGVKQALQQRATDPARSSRCGYIDLASGLAHRDRQSIGLALRIAKKDLGPAIGVFDIFPPRGKARRRLAAEHVGGAKRQTVRRRNHCPAAIVVGVVHAIDGDRHPGHAVLGAPQLEAATDFGQLLETVGVDQPLGGRRRAVRVLQEHRPVEGGHVKPALVFAHPPRVAGKDVVEPGPDPGQGIFHPVRGFTRLTDQQIPTVVRPDPDDLAGRRADQVGAVIAAILDRTADVKRAVEFGHAHRDFRQWPTLRPLVDHLAPAQRPVAAGRGGPDLIAFKIVERAGIKLTVRHGHHEDAVVGGIAKTQIARHFPVAGLGVVRAHQHAAAVRVELNPLARRGGVKIAVKRHQFAEGRDVVIADSGFAGGLEVQPVLRAQHMRRTAADHG